MCNFLHIMYRLTEILIKIFFQADRSEALLDLIQFFIHAAGCKGTITPQMLRDATEGFQEVIKKMTEEFDEVSCISYTKLLIFCLREKF